MSTVGVVGAGVMGVGVAQDLAQAGHRVVLVDLTTELLDDAMARLWRDARMSPLMGGPAVDPDEVVARVTPTTELADLHDAEIVVENIVEDWDAKRDLYHRLERVVGPDCVFVVNTSAIPITRVGAELARPTHLVGVHFMNPVPMKPAAELIRGHHTTDESVARVRAMLDSMGKHAIPVGDACGFVSNRVLMLTVNEAAFLVHEGVATADVVDQVFRECFGHPMGPLETADLIGVDTILLSVEVLYEHYADSKYRPCPLLKSMVSAGLLGRKAGAGFHRYSDVSATAPAALTRS